MVCCVKARMNYKHKWYKHDSDNETIPNVERRMQTIKSYDFEAALTLENMQKGMYANKLIVHDLS